MGQLGRRAASMVLVVVAAVASVSACTSGQPSGGQASSASGTPSTTSDSSRPPVVRVVPPQQRQALASLAPQQVCDLVTPADLARLAFPVQPGVPREVSFDPPVRGCSFDEPNKGGRSVLVGVQPPGFDRLGLKDASLHGAPGTKTEHANDCTVFSPVSGAALQVTVRTGESDSSRCETAEAVTEYVLPALVR